MHTAYSTPALVIICSCTCLLWLNMLASHASQILDLASWSSCLPQTIVEIKLLGIQKVELKLTQLVTLNLGCWNAE